MNNQCERLTFFSSPVFKKPGILMDNIMDSHLLLFSSQTSSNIGNVNTSV